MLLKYATETNNWITLRNNVVFLDSSLDGEKMYNVYQIQILLEIFWAPKIGHYEEMWTLWCRIFSR
jgi:hypothetical protein